MKKDKPWWAVLLLVLTLPGGAAAVDGIDEGIEYRRLGQTLNVGNKQKIEVMEIFWYGCPHCYNLQPLLEHWRARQGDAVAWRRVPAILGEGWAIHARAYYTAEGLGVAERMHAALFDAIHRERRRLNDEKALTAFFAEHGVEPARFQAAFHSFAVDAKVRQARALTQQLQLDGVPAVVVNGTFLTSPTLTAGRERMMTVLDALVAEARR
ncbi:thiol:disulfide interchange protein DsbA/DsbL [Sulfurivermis fontis]|uniref:thiol:disulfide interchange protein DsbA/DsbL n=1 Tax=Sulfurivermis fontis TaxID=1972068 RepID=UPI001559D478|nr:thiol:disulfide interchange protein DsbA/DsbL [Sulfurivermis fontis]